MRVSVRQPPLLVQQTERATHVSTLHSTGLVVGADGMVWGSVLGFPGGIVRLNPGSNPPETALAEYYEVPWHNPKAPVSGYSPRGMDIDSNNVVWVALGSGHLAGSTGENAKGLSTVPKQLANIAPKAGLCILLPVRTFIM